MFGHVWTIALKRLGEASPGSEVRCKLDGGWSWFSAVGEMRSTRRHPLPGFVLGTMYSEILFFNIFLCRDCYILSASPARTLKPRTLPNADQNNTVQA